MTPGFQWQVSMLGPVGAWYYCKEVEAACTYKAHVPSVLIGNGALPLAALLLQDNRDCAACLISEP